MLRTWEPLQQEGYLGCAVIVPGHVTVAGRRRQYPGRRAARRTGATTYYAASAWDRAGEIKDLGGLGRLPCARGAAPDQDARARSGIESPR